MKKVAVIGAGTMGHGIAQVAAMAGFEVWLSDREQPLVDLGLDKVAQNLDKGVARGKVTPEQQQAALSQLNGTTDLATLASEADLIIEAIPERLDLKTALFQRLEPLAPAHCIFGTNTSSLSIASIASALSDPTRLIGAHFFNPVHIMKLLEVIVGEDTRADVVETTKAFGKAIGKEVIVVRDVPGFATSRLGVALGMEAIRMVEQGVASPEDIDTAMVLGYRHPVGPLKLTDMVGLDVRMHIGEYLADALNNPAFTPPELMRKMVADGRLGKKSGRGFYDW
jgi:3-hydroxybutyryl-CoA dehydrogenase